MNEIARVFIFIGILLFLIGIVLLFHHKIPWLGKLPGDIIIKKENFSFYFPVTTGILISILLSIMFYLWQKK